MRARPLSGLEWPEGAWVRNRDRARAARRGRHWCGRCDAALVSPWGRCPVCRARANRKVSKRG